MIPVGTRVTISEQLEGVAVRLHNRSGTVVGHREASYGLLNDIQIDGEIPNGPYDPWAVEGRTFGLPDIHLSTEASA